MERIEKTIVCQVIDDYVAEMMGEGYYFCISITKEYEGGERETEGTEWWVHPNGTFSGGISIQYPNEPPEEVIRFGGTFEKSKYNEYVKQMQDFNGDWEEELVYDDALFYDATVVSEYEEEDRRKMPRQTFDFSELDPSELPF